jgi:hypothetical protein
MLFFTFNAFTYSQQDTTRGNFWINSSIPPFPKLSGLILNYSFNYAIENLSFNLQAFHAKTHNIINNPEYYKLDFFSTAIGYRLRYKYLMTAYFIGIGYTQITNYHLGLMSVSTIGLISNFQFYTYPFTPIGIDGLGIGFELVSNFNNKHNLSFYHFSFNIHF